MPNVQGLNVHLHVRDLKGVISMEKVAEMKEFIKSAELSQMDQLKELAFEMIKYNKESGKVTVAEYDTQWFVTVQISIPKEKTPQ